MEVSVVSQNGKLMDTNVKLVTPGDSEVIFPNKPGMYFLRVKQTAENGEVKLFQTGFTVPYSEEYLLKGTNKQLLKELAASAGGRELKSPGEAFRALKEKPMEKKPISEQLLLAAFLLLSLEILLRRFGLKPFLLLYRKLKVQSKVKSSDSTVVFEQLSKAKEKVNFKVKNGLKEAVTDPQKEEKTGQKGKKQPSRVREKLEKTITAEEKEARMKRLLDAKKRKT